MNTVRIDRRVLLVLIAIALVALGVLVALSPGGGPLHDLGASMVEYAVLM